VTIVTYYHRPKRAGKAKPAVEFPHGRIVTVKPSRKRHYDEIIEGVPDAMPNAPVGQERLSSGHCWVARRSSEIGAECS
jgi:hypothetical protein